MGSVGAKLAAPYQLDRGAGRWDAVVIGSGIGGLSAAALLSRYDGKRVLVLERHYTPGGFTHTFRRPGAGRGTEVERTNRLLGNLSVCASTYRKFYAG